MGRHYLYREEWIFRETICDRAAAQTDVRCDYVPVVQLDERFPVLRLRPRRRRPGQSARHDVEPAAGAARGLRADQLARRDPKNMDTPNGI